MKATDFLTGLTADRLRYSFSYDPASGEFRRLSSGIVAGNTHKTGYRQIRIAGRMYQAHRLAWLYMTGAWPEHEVDHKNLQKDDNRWSNLRAATRGQNICNSPHGRTYDLPRGVYARGALYRAQIRKHGKLTSLGTFASVEAASTAYREAANNRHGEFVYRGMT